MAKEEAIRLESWAPGEELDHRKLNQPVEALRKLTSGINPIRQIVPNANSIAPVAVAQFKIVLIYGDTLVCNPFDGVLLSDSGVRVARPYLLRTSLGSRNGISYDYSGVQSREADDGDDTEEQVVVPSYVIGDIIYAVRNVAGGTSLVYGSGNTPVIWLDLNVDGRAWAKVAS